MGKINLTNSKGRDAVVQTESVRSPLRVRWLDEQGQQATNVRFLRSTVHHDIDALLGKSGRELGKVGAALITGDPEIDPERFGRFLRETSRVYMNPQRKIVYRVQEWEIIRNPDGTERERRLRKIPTPNTATEVPLRWSGRLMKKSEVYNRFVFAEKKQIVHVNGLSYDFLYAMAKELEAKDCLMWLGAGPKTTEPLVFYRGGTPYRGFLEGRTEGDKYILLLHLSNLELKAPEEPS